MKPNYKKMEKLLRATSELHMQLDATTEESAQVLVSLACVIAHEMCEPKETLLDAVSRTYDHIGSGAEQHPVQ
jgi:hypothetical protein